MKRLILIAVAAGALGACQADRGDVAETREDLQQARQEGQREIAEERQEAQQEIAEKRQEVQEDIADERQDYRETLRSYTQNTLPQEGAVYGIVVMSTPDAITLRDQQGQQTQMQLRPDARVTRDGQQVSPTQIQEGTPVRASFERQGQNIQASEVEMGTDVSREFRQAGQEMRQGAQDLGQGVQQGAQDLGQGVQQGAQQLEDQAGESMENTGEQMQR